jgi:predicted short-subunit dehydrogenase-like oxidoreductase (DUF2520 family)
MHSLSVIGGGHVGRALGRLFAQAGAPGCAAAPLASASAPFELRSVLARSLASSQRAVDFIGAGTPADGYAALRPADVYMLAVGDDQIVPACAALAAAVPLQGAIVFHCSGALASDRLQAARDAGAYVASVHPIRSFADPEAVAAAFAGTFCGIEGDPQALAVLEPALLAIGARPVPIDAAAKTVYHAAAVFASNYLTTVLDAALRAYQAAGIPEATARELAQPLVTETVANVFRLGAAPALSGPIARGDMVTVARQQQAVTQWDAPTGELYQALVAPTVSLARRKHNK